MERGEEGGAGRGTPGLGPGYSSRKGGFIGLERLKGILAWFMTSETGPEGGLAWNNGDLSVSAQLVGGRQDWERLEETGSGFAFAFSCEVCLCISQTSSTVTESLIKST